MCWFKVFLDLNVLSHWLHGIDTPSKWFASMWFLITVAPPSLPHILQIFAFFWQFPSIIVFWLVSIIDMTVVSKSCKSLDKSLVFGKTNAWFSFLLASFVDSVELDFASKFDGLWDVFLAGLVEGGKSFCFVSKNSFWSLDPCRPYSCSSSAIQRKLSKFSWKTLASPK